jgi:hypothetical protein
VRGDSTECEQEILSDVRRSYIISPMAHNVLVPLRSGRQIDSATAAGDERRIRQHRASTPVSVELIKRIENVSLDDSLAVQAVFDSISAIRDIDTKIEACGKLLARNPRDFVDKLKLLLAFCYGEEKYDLFAALQLLEDIVENGSDVTAQSIARELMTMYRRQREEFKNNVREEDRAEDEFENLAAMDPFTIDAPTVFHWISQKEYDYLEGGVWYGRDHYWSRAFLFIRPYYLLIIDAIWCKFRDKVIQLFHMPPPPSVTHAGDRYLLSAADSLRCII